MTWTLSIRYEIQMASPDQLWEPPTIKKHDPPTVYATLSEAEAAAREIMRSGIMIGQSLYPAVIVTFIDHEP